MERRVAQAALADVRLMLLWIRCGRGLVAATERSVEASLVRSFESTPQLNEVDPINGDRGILKLRHSYPVVQHNVLDAIAIPTAR